VVLKSPETDRALAEARVCNGGNNSPGLASGRDRPALQWSSRYRHRQAEDGKHVQDYVWEMQVGNSEIVKQTFREKLDYPGRRKGRYFGGPFCIESSG
jgi:hypothetical protein